MAPSRLHAVRPSPHPAAPRYPLQWIMHATTMLPGQTPAQNEPGSPQFTFSGDPSAAEPCSGGLRRRPHEPNCPGRPISNRRPRLERRPL